MGHGFWIQREPHCRRWRIWRTRVPKWPASNGPYNGGEAASGVREPRRPPPSGGGGHIALDPPPG
jgi:hypothetical protein